LAKELGEARLIDPDGRCQLDSALVKLPNIPRVTNLEDALGTIRQIKEEGEGATASGIASHFDRFQEIKAEWQSLSAEDAGFIPAWPAAHDPVMRKPAKGAPRVWITEPEAAACLDLANATYGTMLSVLAQAFGGSSAEDKLILMRVSVELMEASAALASQLARMPASASHPGVNAGMTFAVPRNSGYRPLEHRARAIFLERTEQLRAGAQDALAASVAEKAVRRLENAIALLDGSTRPD
ncbi:MAG: hypothetical protein JWM38_2321, partial [Sphingomonas bacterium]|nr:hypothetical protein [Sphingomonas bacterium]